MSETSEIKVDAIELQVISHLLKGRTPNEIAEDEGGATGEKMADIAEEFTGGMDSKLDESKRREIAQAIRDENLTLEPQKDGSHAVQLDRSKAQQITGRKMR